MILLEMNLTQNNRALSHMIMTAVTLGGLALSSPIAKAGVIPITFTTIGTFSAGTPSELSYTPTSFTGVTSEAGYLLLPDVGQFNLNELANPQGFNGNTFSLHLTFLMPLGITGSVDFAASLSGHINDNGNGNVHVNFTPNSKVIPFSNDAASGSFTLAVNDVIGLRQGDTPILTGSIAAAADPTSVAPEPGSFLLFGSALVALSSVVRRTVVRRALVR